MPTAVLRLLLLLHIANIFIGFLFVLIAWSSYSEPTYTDHYGKPAGPACLTSLPFLAISWGKGSYQLPPDGMAQRQLLLSPWYAVRALCVLYWSSDSSRRSRFHQPIFTMPADMTLYNAGWTG